jgi:hypothetical protein
MQKAALRNFPVRNNPERDIPETRKNPAIPPKLS